MFNSNHTGPHDKLHWSCCWKASSGKLLWWFSVVTFLGGLAALWQGGEFWGVSVQTWYWNALVSGVLALGAKFSKFHRCWHQQ